MLVTESMAAGFGTSGLSLNQSCLVTSVTDAIVCGCYAAPRKEGGT